MDLEQTSTLDLQAVLKGLDTEEKFGALAAAIRGELQKRREKNYRPYTLMATERTTKRTIENFAWGTEEDRNRALEEFQNQLGQKAYEYGLLVDRVETYLAEGKYELLTEVNPDGASDGIDYIHIRDRWETFARDIHEWDRVALLDALDKSKFSKITIYKECEDGQLRYKQLDFIRSLTEGKIERKADGTQAERLLFRGQKLKREVRRVPEFIELRINRPIYEGVLQYLGNKNKEGRRKIEGAGVIPVPQRLAMDLKKTLEGIQEAARDQPLLFSARPDDDEDVQAILKTRYTDRFRVLAERIIEFYERGKEKRRSDYFLIDGAEIWEMLFPSAERRTELYVRLGIMLQVVQLVLSANDYPFRAITYNRDDHTVMVSMGPL